MGVGDAVGPWEIWLNAFSVGQQPGRKEVCGPTGMGYPVTLRN